MDILIGIVTSVLAKIAECTIEPIGRQLGYIAYYRRHINDLKTQIRLLEEEKDKLQHLIDEATNRGEEIEKNVQNWNNTVNDIIQKSQRFFEAEDQANTRCFKRSFLNLTSRHQKSRKVKKMADAVANEIEEARKISCNKISYRSTFHGSVENRGYETFTSRFSTFTEIMVALKDPNVSKIGVYGMPGVGKTMLAKEVENQALKQLLFDVAVLVPISKTPDFKDIQQIIADKLALEFYEKTVLARADRLRDQLMKQKKKILIILDDVWEKLKLDDVGISFREDQKESKILLTTRFESVCKHMDTERKFQVGVLNNDESTSLFNKILGSSTVKNNCVDGLAVEIIKECAGLPLVITTIASALKEKGRPIWEYVLKGLRKSNPTEIDGVQGNVYLSIQLSYDFLSVDARSLLVLCSLHEEDADIDVDLLMKCGLFQGIDKVEEARAKVFYLVDILKTSSMLLDGLSPNNVKMHDVIRDVVISIASRDERMHITQDVIQLEESLPTYKDSIAISLLHNNDEGVRLPEKLVCPRLKLFLMFGSNRSSEIPESFFEEARELRVLLLTSACFKRVQSYFLVLQNLQTLCLRDCTLEDTASIGELKSLRILDLARSHIEKLPKEIGQLTKLKLLDLSYCRSLKTIEPDMISSLTNLEELNMRESFTSWTIDEVNGERRNNASLVELSGLQLSALYLKVGDTTVLPKKKWLNENYLKRYEILIGPNWRWSWVWDARGISTSRLAVKLNHFSDLDEYKIQTLLKTSEEVCLDGLVGIRRDVFFGLDKDGLSQLKHLEFKNNDEIQYIINSMDQIHVSAFPKLESLVLSGLMNLEKICRGKLDIDSFGKLRIVTVTNCAKLKYLLPVSVTRQLESIEVDECTMMEEIIVRGEDYSHNISNDAIDDKIEYTQLHTLKLHALPQLKRFCYDLKMTSISERIEEPTDANTAFSLFNQKFALPALRELNISSTDNLEKIWEYPWLSTSADHSFRKLEEIYVVGCKNIQKVLPSPMWARRLPNLRHLHICDCEVLQEVFEIERSNSSVEEREATASQLSYLLLDNLSKLKHVWPKDSQGSSHLFQNLKVIYVSNCHNLESLCPPSVAKGLLQLQTLEIRSCDVLKEIISNNDGEEEKETVPHKVVFPQLTSLYLRGLPQLVSFYPAEPQGLSFQEEKSGLIEANYPIKQQQPHSSMDEVAFPILRNIYIGYMDNLKTIWAYTSTVADSFSNLEKITVSYCKNLEKILPPSMWSSLQKLTKLSINRCKMLEEVFEIEIRSNVEETTPQLRYPELHYLSKLNVWTKDPQDNHMLFQNLKDIELSGCPKLQSLFPPFIAKGLLRLEHLAISDCEMLKEIVSKEEEETYVIEKVPKLMLPQLKYLTLTNLPHLLSFYPTLHTSEWPSLESLEVKECAKVTVLAMKVVSRIIEEEKSGILAPINNQTQKPFFLMEKVTFPKLKCLILTGNIDIPEEFAKVFSSLTESKPFQRPKLLHRLWEDVIQNLETLHLSGCGSLKKLVLSSSVSFQNLTTLTVSKCCGLLNLVTLPIARSLGQKLRSMSILECENMTEIIAQEEEEEGGDTEGGEIVFSQLEILILDNLPSLTHFYSGNYMMRFPNLGSATVSKCFEMRSFCIHGVTTHKLDKIFTELPLHLYVDTKFHFDRIEYDNYLRGELWKGDINMTLEELWKTRHNNPLTSIQEDAEKDIEKNSQEISENKSEDESKRSSKRDSGEDSEQKEDSKNNFKKDFQQKGSKKNSDKDSASISDLEEDSEKDSKEDADDEEEDIENDNNHIENFDEDSKMTSKESSEQDSRDIIDKDSEESSKEDSEKDSKEDTDDEEEDIENDNNHIENFDEDSKMTSKESSEQDSKDDIDEDSEESSEEDSDKKGHSTKEASEKDSEDDFEEKSETDSSESVSETDKEEDSSYSEQN